MFVIFVLLFWMKIFFFEIPCWYIGKVHIFLLAYANGPIFWFGLVLGIFWWSGLANMIWSATADVWKNLRLVTFSLTKYLQNILIIALEVNKKGRKKINTLVLIIQSIVFYYSFFSFLFTVVNYQNCSYAEVTRKFKGRRDE